MKDMEQFTIFHQQEVVIGSPNGMVIMIIINQKKGGLWSQKYHRYRDVSDIFLIEWEIIPFVHGIL